MSEYAGKQFVGIDLHRRRSVVVRTTVAGEVLESVQIPNDVECLGRVMSRAGGGFRGGARGVLWLVLGGRCAAGGGREGAPGPSVASQRTQGTR